MAYYLPKSNLQARFMKQGGCLAIATRSSFLLFLLIVLSMFLAACQVEPVAVTYVEAQAPSANQFIPENPPVRVLAGRPVVEIVGDSKALLAALSPDGSTIGWIRASGRMLSQRVTEVCIFILYGLMFTIEED